MKNIFILISLLYNVSLAIAQTNYYTTTKTFNEQGYIYQCDVDTESGDINLYNKNNKWTYIKQMKKGTNTPFYVTPENYSPLYVKDKNEAYNDSIFKVIVNNMMFWNSRRGELGIRKKCLLMPGIRYSSTWR